MWLIVDALLLLNLLNEILFIHFSAENEFLSEAEGSIHLE
jgi:hypothetical protein